MWAIDVCLPAFFKTRNSVKAGAELTNIKQRKKALPLSNAWLIHLSAKRHILIIAFCFSLNIFITFLTFNVRVYPCLTKKPSCQSFFILRQLGCPEASGPVALLALNPMWFRASLPYGRFAFFGIFSPSINHTTETL